MWARGDLPYVHPYRLIRREVVEVAYRHLGGRVGKVVASDVSMCSNFVKGCGVARSPLGFKEVYDAREESLVVMVIPRATGASVRVVLSDRLEAGEGVGEYTDPIVVLECSETVCMATSSALMMVRLSSVPAASMNMVVVVGICTTAAPSLGKPLMSEPSV